MKSVIQERRMNRAALFQQGYLDAYAGHSNPELMKMSTLDRQWYLDGGKLAAAERKQANGRKGSR